MPEPLNTDPIEIEVELTPAAQFEFDEQWIAYLEETEIPSTVDGIDPSENYREQDGDTAYA